MSQISFVVKALIVGFLTLLLLIPLSMINGTIRDRQSYRLQAMEKVERSYAGQLKFAGPVLIVPFQDIETVITVDNKGIEKQHKESTDSFWIFYPKILDASGDMVPDNRKVGIFNVRTYEWNAKMKANFDFNTTDSGNPLIKRTVGLPYLSFLMNDTRGLKGTPKLMVAGEKRELRQGAGNHGIAAKEKGLHVSLPKFVLATPQKFSVDMDLSLGGTESLSFVPIADSNRISIHSSWQDPNFTGDFSPRNSKVDETGFVANWDISSLSASAQTDYRNGVALGSIESLQVNLMDAVDLYTQLDRASKYGMLFIVLTFVGFLMFEIIKQLAIHPIQYGLVGLSLAIFFVLLLSLSEKIDFVWAYLTASIACIGLLTMYVSSVLKSFTRGLSFSAMLTILYGALYGLLISEDNALLMGSILLFTVLAAIMLATRKVDWYQLGKKEIPQV